MQNLNVLQKRVMLILGFWWAVVLLYWPFLWVVGVSFGNKLANWSIYNGILFLLSNVAGLLFLGDVIVKSYKGQMGKSWRALVRKNLMLLVVPILVAWLVIFNDLTRPYCKTPTCESQTLFMEEWWIKGRSMWF